MELTLDLDDDLFKLLEAEALRSGESIQQTVNRLLRAALIPTPKATDKPHRL